MVCILRCLNIHISYKAPLFLYPKVPPHYFFLSGNWIWCFCYRVPSSPPPSSGYSIPGWGTFLSYAIIYVCNYFPRSSYVSHPHSLLFKSEKVSFRSHSTSLRFFSPICFGSKLYLPEINVWYFRRWWQCMFDQESGCRPPHFQVFKSWFIFFNLMSTTSYESRAPATSPDMYPTQIWGFGRSSPLMSCTLAEGVRSLSSVTSSAQRIWSQLDWITQPWNLTCGTSHGIALQSWATHSLQQLICQRQVV